MKEKPLAVAIAALIKDNKILLIERVRGDYVGFWSLPGGKIEKDEHFSEAAMREIFEESGIESDFEKYLGLVSEHLVENGIIEHFLLHICKLTPKTIAINSSSEGKLQWFDLDFIQKCDPEANNSFSEKIKIVPSDFLMIKNMAMNDNNNYYECVIEKAGDDHFLRKFE